MCKKHGLAAWHAANPTKASEYYRKRKTAEYMAAARARATAWQLANKERAAARKAAWHQATLPKRAEKLAAQRIAWKVANRDKVAAKEARRRSAKLLATPKWANEFFIEEAYALAKLRTEILGFRWEVDHIVPLISPLVCGLHCEANIQVIPESLNRSKANRHWPDMPR